MEYVSFVIQILRVRVFDYVCFFVDEGKVFISTFMNLR